MTDPIDYDDLDKRFNYHAPDEDKASCHQAVREAARRMAVSVLQATPKGREQSLALTKIEEAMFWANAAVARGTERQNP